tara:strand:- start:1937 stop:3049 length:1113 start_codon:yes stop_codon:yes gene_type:complete
MVHRYTDWKINSFAEAEERYNTTKPVISKNHTKEQDIRPYGARSRKWERIEKVNANCYIIWNGDDGDPYQQFYWNWSGSLNPTPKQQMELAPIVWKRKGNMESIRIRNGSGNYAHCSRYTFLENTLPHNMGFLVIDGKQYVSLLNTSEKQNFGTGRWHGHLKYLLPKSMYVPFNKHRHGSNFRNHGFVEKDDKKYLTFERKIGEPNTTPWQVVGATWEYIGAKTKVDKQGKADIKPHTDKFYEWIVTMYRMLPITDWEYRSKMRNELQEWVNDNFPSSCNDFAFGNPHVAYMEIMRDEEHPMRLHLAVDWLTHSNLTEYRWDTEGGGNREEFVDIDSDVAKRVRANWNRYINKQLGLISKAEVEKIERRK